MSDIRYQRIYLGEIQILKNLSKTFLMQIDYTHDDKESLDKQLKVLKILEQFKHPHIIQLKQYKLKEISNLCSTQYKLQTLYEYFQDNLKLQFLNRVRSKERFPPIQLLRMIYDCIEGYSYFENNNINILDIHPCLLFTLNNEDDDFLRVKICNRFQGANNIKENLFSNIQKDQELYMTPEDFENLKINNFKYPRENYKCDVFSLGLIFLEMANLKNIQGVFNLNNGQFDENKLKQYISIFQNQYQSSSFLIELVKTMLQLNPKERLSFQQIKKNLPNWSIIIDMIKDSQIQQHIKNDKKLEIFSNPQVEPKESLNIKEKNYPISTQKEKKKKNYDQQKEQTQFESLVELKNFTNNDLDQNKNIYNNEYEIEKQQPRQFTLGKVVSRDSYQRNEIQQNLKIPVLNVKKSTNQQIMDDFLQENQKMQKRASLSNKVRNFDTFHQVESIDNSNYQSSQQNMNSQNFEQIFNKAIEQPPNNFSKVTSKRSQFSISNPISQSRQKIEFNYQNNSQGQRNNDENKYDLLEQLNQGENRELNLKEQSILDSINYQYLKTKENDEEGFYHKSFDQVPIVQLPDEFKKINFKLQNYFDIKQEQSFHQQNESLVSEHKEDHQLSEQDVIKNSQISDKEYVDQPYKFEIENYDYYSKNERESLQPSNTEQNQKIIQKIEPIKIQQMMEPDSDRNNSQYFGKVTNQINISPIILNDQQQKNNEKLPDKVKEKVNNKIRKIQINQQYIHKKSQELLGSNDFFFDQIEQSQTVIKNQIVDIPLQEFPDSQLDLIFDENPENKITKNQLLDKQLMENDNEPNFAITFSESIKNNSQQNQHQIVNQFDYKQLYQSNSQENILDHQQKINQQFQLDQQVPKNSNFSFVQQQYKQDKEQVNIQKPSPTFIDRSSDYYNNERKIFSMNEEKKENSKEFLEQSERIRRIIQQYSQNQLF